MQPKIAALLERLKTVEHELIDPDLVNDQKRYKTLAQEHSYLLDVKHLADEISTLLKQIEDNNELLQQETDQEFIDMLQQDVAKLVLQREAAQKKLQTLLVPPSPYDNANTILELRAGAGGQEAMLFVADCVRMYQLLATAMGWKCEPLSATESDLGGFKEYIMVVSGHNVYRMLQYEGGTHRVQRVPETEAQGRIHTSTITVAVLLEAEETDVVINEQDLRMETTRSSGAGGQHVNKTDSAVRITHIPTGIAVFCQQERSQHKNREKAMRLLRAKLSEMDRQKRKQEIDATRAQQVGSADRSEKIRTYNFPQNRFTDHRINLTKYNLNQIMNGDLVDIVLQLINHFQQV